MSETNRVMKLRFGDLRCRPYNTGHTLPCDRVILKLNIIVAAPRAWNRLPTDSCVRLHYSRAN